jgi:hypothetical protein
MKRYHPRMTPRAPTHPKHELAQAVFHSVYSSREQRRRRQLAALLLTAKHTVRGLLFSWPLYLMVYAGFHTDAPINVFLWALGVPGIAISMAILARGIREEYRARIVERLLKPGDLLKVLRGGTA